MFDKYRVALWLDDVRPIPKNYMENNLCNRVIWCHSVNEAIEKFELFYNNKDSIIGVIDMDHDAGDYVLDGGDYINFLSWLEIKDIDFTDIVWKIHSMNPVGVKNMERILNKHGVYSIRGGINL